MKFCFLCLWDGRSTAGHYTSSVTGKPRETNEPVTDGVQHVPHVNPTKTFLPALHIKTGLTKFLVKATAKKG